MTRIFHPLLAMIASATDYELAKYVECLKAENKILRARIPGQIPVTPEERQRLLKFGKVIGRAIEELMTVDSSATFYRWVRDENADKEKPGNPRCGQRKPRKIRKLVIQIAKTTGFGYTLIIGELRTLEIKTISRQTVRNILKQKKGMQPGPDRTKDNRDNFIVTVHQNQLTLGGGLLLNIALAGAADSFVVGGLSAFVLAVGAERFSKVVGSSPATRRI